jgi:Zn-dependent protease with chaperone function
VKYTLRALLALALLIGFYVFALGVVAALVWGAVELSRAGVSGYALGKLWIFVIVIGFVVVKALLGRRKKENVEPGGFLLSPQAEPALWAEVNAIAEFAGTRAPDEIRLVPQVNAAVSEESRWLGLVRGTRRLYLGVPLMLGLTRDQLRSVLAHELGHYSGHHTALGSLTYRGQEAIGRVIAGLGVDSWTAKIFKLYARLYYAVSHTVNRRQELEADQLSATLVGSATAASALRELMPLGSAWDFYLDSYADLGSSVGHRPTDLYDAFGEFLASPVRQEQLAQMRLDATEPPRSVFDTHPATSERVTRIEAMSRPSTDDASGPAVALLATGTLARAQEALWEGDRRKAAPLAAIVPLAGADVTRHNAQVARAQLHAAGVSPDLAGALALFRSGRAADLLRPMNPGAADEALRSGAGRLVGDLAASHLVDAGRAAHRLNYDAEWRFTDPDGAEVEPWPVAVAAAHDPAATEDFEAWLQTHQIELGGAAESVDVTLPRRDLPAPDEILAACAPVGGRFRTVVVLGQGVVLRKARAADRLAVAKASFLGNTGEALIRQAVKDGVPALLQSPASTLLRWEDIRSATFRGKMLDRGVLTLDGPDGQHTVKLIMETHKVGEPLAAIEHFLEGRFQRS